MRSQEFLLEYDRSREQQRIEALPSYQARLKQDPRFSLERLESADPTPQKTYVPRLVQWWLAGEPTEDLISTTADALEKYHKLKTKKQIKSEHADINRFKTADAFGQAVSQYQLPQDQPKEDRGKYREIFRDNELLVVELLDQQAAVFWGQGTRWCTAAKNNNMFNYYFRQGPLYVIIPRDDPQNKYQYWFKKSDPYDFQFMDIADTDSNPAQLPFYHKLQSIMVKINPHIMWKSNPTDQEQLEAVKLNPYFIKWINQPTLKVQLAAARVDGSVIEIIKNPSLEVQLAAVTSDGGALKYIPNPSEDACLAAVNENGYAIQYIKNPSEAVQMAAVNRDGQAIGYIDDPSEAVQLAAVKENPRAIGNIKNPTPNVVKLYTKLGAQKTNANY